jgi:heme/copper-type cytochrome/quinol oxidase subunit 1
MKLSAPKQVTWWVAVVVGLLGFIGNFVALPVISGLSFWLLFIGFALLALATFMDGL